jgi:1-acyl-sn-glycerol-3-phosphate acyltransferase
MRLLIALLKLVLIILSTTIFYLIISLGLLISFFGLSGRKWIAYFLSTWASSICRIINVDVIVEGEVPQPPFFLVSNHLSYLDIFVILSKTRSVFIAKNEILSWPIFGFMSHTVGMLFVDRNKRSDVKRVNDQISNRISEAQGILLFPEGTTTNGSKILPFKASLLAYPAKNNVPVHYATLRYSTPRNEKLATDYVCWWNDTPFPTHFLNLLKLKKIEATIQFGSEPIVNSDRKELAKSLYRNASKQFVPVRNS